jgi:hypothetical protein
LIVLTETLSISASASGNAGVTPATATIPVPWKKSWIQSHQTLLLAGGGAVVAVGGALWAYLAIGGGHASDGAQASKPVELGKPPGDPNAGKTP